MKNINIAEILKRCPKGMKLNCTMYKDVELDFIDENPEAIYPIHCLIKTNIGNNESVVFTDYGCSDTHPNAKCVIFPEDKTTWEDFQRPFQNGEIIIDDDDESICIFKKEGILERTIDFYCGIICNEKFIIKDNNDPDNHFGDILDYRLATEEEKQKLFDAIKANGYRWNAETKTLEKLIKPKFKVGDVVQDKDGYKVEITNIEIDDEYYGYLSKIANGIGTIDFKDQNNWELVPNKFDISTLIPFESKVLVRDFENQTWKPAIWGFYDDNAKNYPYAPVGGVTYEYLIPFEDNEHLLGTTNDCNNYYKTWEK